MAQKIIAAMNETQDADLIKVYTNALDELGIRYMFDRYIGQWVQTDGYTSNELARMGVR